MLYWFEKEGLLCTGDGTSFTVENGQWDFKIKNGNAVLDTGKIVIKNISEPVQMTSDEFYKLHPNFGY